MGKGNRQLVVLVVVIDGGRYHLVLLKLPSSILG
jgi:hypothetical protein